MVTVKKTFTLAMGTSCLLDLDGSFNGPAVPLCRKLAGICGESFQLMPEDVDDRIVNFCSEYNISIVDGGETGTPDLRFCTLPSPDPGSAVPACCLQGMPGNCDDTILHIAFDYDLVLADTSKGTAILEQDKDLAAYHQFEIDRQDDPHKPGPLFPLFSWLGSIRDTLTNIDRDGPGNVQISIITARSMNTAPRMFTSLRQWGVEPDRVLLLGASRKHPFLRAQIPDLYIDDKQSHLKSAQESMLCAHIRHELTSG